jgi:ferric-dicitrate binding protein FerR (iron transport regulator)
MAVAEQIAPYVNRLFDDDYVRDQLGDALVRGRRAYRRARADKAAEAVKDKRLMNHLTGAAHSLQAALRGLTNEPPPSPRRRRLRSVALLGAALTAGAVAVYVDRREERQAGP